MEWWQLYLLLVLPGVAESVRFDVGFFALMGGTFWCLALIPMNVIYEPVPERLVLLHRRAGYVLTAMLAIWTLALLVPSETAMFAMLGGYVVTNTDGVENLPDNFVGAANAFLERYAESESDR